jgi:hypothetical protein
MSLPKKAGFKRGLGRADSEVTAEGAHGPRAAQQRKNSWPSRCKAAARNPKIDVGLRISTALVAIPRRSFPVALQPARLEKASEKLFFKERRSH